MDVKITIFVIGIFLQKEYFKFFKFLTRLFLPKIMFLLITTAKFLLPDTSFKIAIQCMELDQDSFEWVPKQTG